MNWKKSESQKYGNDIKYAERSAKPIVIHPQQTRCHAFSGKCKSNRNSNFVSTQ